MAGIMQMLTSASPLAQALICDSADFDGTNDQMLRGADLTGSADSKKGIFSGWIRIDGGDGADLPILRNFLNGIKVQRFTDNKLRVFAENAGGSVIFDIRTVNTYTSGASWIHMLASWDLATAGARHLYINDTSDLAVTTFTNDTIDYTQTEWVIGDLTSSACFAEIYFMQGQYLDITVAENRRKFISAGGKPVNLSANGSLPVGATPQIYLHLDDGEAVANFATNRGGGGNFSITGTLATGSTSPSD